METTLTRIVEAKIKWLFEKKTTFTIYISEISYQNR